MWPARECSNMLGTKSIIKIFIFATKYTLFEQRHVPLLRTETTEEIGTKSKLLRPLPLDFKPMNDENTVCESVFDGILVANPKSCRHYFACNEGHANEGSCAEGYAFNEDKQQCDPEDQVDCVLCGDERFETHADPKSCLNYYWCINGKRTKWSCSPGTRFDKKSSSCKPRKEARCDVTNICRYHNSSAIDFLVGDLNSCHKWVFCILKYSRYTSLIRKLRPYLDTISARIIRRSRWKAFVQMACCSIRLHWSVSHESALQPARYAHHMKSMAFSLIWILYWYHLRYSRTTFHYCPTSQPNIQITSVIAWSHPGSTLNHALRIEYYMKKNFTDIFEEYVFFVDIIRRINVLSVKLNNFRVNDRFEWWKSFLSPDLAITWNKFVECTLGRGLQETTWLASGLTSTKKYI